GIKAAAVRRTENERNALLCTRAKLEGRQAREILRHPVQLKLTRRHRRMTANRAIVRCPCPAFQPDDRVRERETPVIVHLIFTVAASDTGWLTRLLPVALGG